MRILHISDTHGTFTPLRMLDEVDIVVHSGDLLPNISLGQSAVETAFQTQWLNATRTKIANWLGGKPLLFCPGNHDYVDPIPTLRFAGVQAVNIKDTTYLVNGVSFHGFPWVPYLHGKWNYEVHEHEIAARLADRPMLCDVLVSHGPLRGLLDKNEDGDRCGSTALKAHLDKLKDPPKWVLHGHIHESAGFVTWKRGIGISNAAQMQRIITV